jgi:hypothetical protein
MDRPAVMKVVRYEFMEVPTGRMIKPPAQPFSSRRHQSTWDPEPYEEYRPPMLQDLENHLHDSGAPTDSLGNLDKSKIFIHYAGCGSHSIELSWEDS